MCLFTPLPTYSRVRRCYTHLPTCELLGIETFGILSCSMIQLWLVATYQSIGILATLGIIMSVRTGTFA